MAERSPLDSAQSGLFRCLPCKNVAESDDGVWQSSLEYQQHIDAQTDLKTANGSGLKKSPYELGESVITMHANVSSVSGRNISQNERIIPLSEGSNICNTIPVNYNNRMEENVEVKKLNRELFVSEKEPVKWWDMAALPNVQNSDTISNSSVIGNQSNVPTTPGSTRRSAIPVSSHRRNSSVSAEDGFTPANISFHTTNGNGISKVAQVTSSGMMLDRASYTSTPKQKNVESVRGNSAKLRSSRRLPDFGTPSKMGNSGSKSSTNFRQNYSLNKTAVLNDRMQSTTGRISNLQRTPVSAVRNGITGSATSEGRCSRIPSKTMSQPGSRSISPSGRLAHMMFKQPETPSTLARPSSARTGRECPAVQNLRPSRIPRSQGHSRDTSPSRLSDGSGKYGRVPSSSRGTVIETPQKMSLLSSNVLRTGLEMEQTIADALTGNLILRREDAASETSSISSESFSQLQPNAVLSSMEIIALISSASWSDRRNGLVALQQMMKSNGVLSPQEVKKVTDVFTRMFHDPNAKVFNAFLETLVDVLEIHSEDMVDWLYTCLSRLLVKLAGDLLGSVQAKIHKALQAICFGFTFEMQMAAIARFIADQSQSANPRVRLAILDHLHEMTLVTEPYDFFNSESCQQVALCVVQWTNDQKSSEIRKAAQGVVIALFNFNTPEFSAVLSKLPRYIQDCATRILHNHMFAISQEMDSESSSERTATSGDTHLEPTAGSSEDYFTSLKKATEDIQSLSYSIN